MSLRLPRVDRILEHPALASSPALRTIQKRQVHEVLAELRRRAQAGEIAEAPEVEAIAGEVARRLAEVMTPRPRALINATGVLLHTNLGRAPLSREAVAAMTAAAGNCELEFEVETGRRGSRLTWLRPLLAALLGTEDVHVVNNGAAALLLACTAVGRPGGVVLSRGQMVEIGDGFRVAEMAAAGGAQVWEAGSTNRTHVADYAAGLAGELPGQSAGASAILWVHLSNFLQAGFVHQPTLGELAALGRERGAPLIADLGSGSLGGIAGDEPTVQEYLAQGAELVTCSGDKLLGGPQAGLLAGSAALVGKCRRHPLARALRPDKTTVAALHATAIAYASGQAETLPLRRMMAPAAEQLRARAGALAQLLGWPLGQVRDSEATVGGGSLPGDVMASAALAVPTADPTATAAALRRAGVVGRVSGGELLLDLRTVAPEEEAALATAVRAVLTG
ncbi:L-seryl-tRNA(Sec) selenium transferase [Nannocystis bainbridge]|uniref:L-seryl-tRNA(Sec) selenium transferase n=1 Tax=Nannocystis bainbridge TaxID=2995303 RepID=A0ABT5E3Z8_9BACT|nr:L-seryl-tRNA(Sec) selenium transferase [Nannocystis bainbridge]MDC0720593.1 L-seryl-tRNA(Sec) selenium transferase [Nannocystis bainbridge]